MEAINTMEEDCEIIRDHLEIHQTILETLKQYGSFAI